MFKLFKQTNYSSDQDLHPKETKPGLTRFLPNLLSQPQLVTSTSHTTSPLCQPSTVRGVPCCDTGLSLAAATQLPGLVRFLCITFVGVNVAAQRPLSQVSSLPGKGTPFHLTNFAPMTFNAKLSTRCSRKSDEERH